MRVVNYVNHLVIWNVRGINNTTKRQEVEDIFKKEKFELLVLTEMKLKGKGKVSWSGVNVIFAGVQEMERDRERVAVLLNSAVVKYGCVGSRILWIKFKLRVIVCVVVGYGPNVDGEEIDRFWNDMDRTLDSVGNG